MIVLSLLALAFLLLLCVLGYGAIRLLSAKGDDGRPSAPGCLGSCALVLVLTVLGVLGFAVFLGGAVVTSPPEEFRDAAREIADEVREGAREIRREVRSEIERERRKRDEAERQRERRAPRSTPVPAPDSQPSPSNAPERTDSEELASKALDSDATASETARTRVVLRWNGHSDPKEELLAALREAGFEDGVAVEVHYILASDGSMHTDVTFSGTVAPANARDFSQRVERAIAEVGGRLGVELSLVELEVEDLR